jgi:3-hydroxybutyryl-CoA dehydratase
MLRPSASDFSGKSFRRVIMITDDLVDSFAALSGDQSPLHVDRSFAKEHGFRDRVAHGNILSLCLSSLVGTALGTPHVMLVSQAIKYRAPCFPGDQIELVASVDHISDAVGVVELSLVFTRLQDGLRVATGSLQVKTL